MGYNFFYDETEHSRKINYQTVTAQNYYDNFISVIVGWKAEEEKKIINRYLEFESKYDYRKQNGELKSQTMKVRDFRMGFASLNNHTIEFYEDFLSVFEVKPIIYFSVFSKIEYVINQIFVDYQNSILVDVELMKYSIIKAINVYKPKKLIEAIYREPKVFVDELSLFLEEQIIKNQDNKILKKREIQVFEEMLMFIHDSELPEQLDWSYFAPFMGFSKLLMEMNISEYSLCIDREGDASNTLNSAIIAGINNAVEEESKECVGIRMADMLAGLISKMMQSLKVSLTGNYKDGSIKKTLLDSGWFAINQRQIELYKQLYCIICEYNRYWFNSYTGIYSDDLIAFISLLQYINHFDSLQDLKEVSYELHPEYYNSFVCQKLEEHFARMKNKLSIDTISNDNSDTFYNQRGAVVYKDIERQPFLPLSGGENKFLVLSAGVSQNGTPLVTISDNDKPTCYRLPAEYCEWAMTVVGMANLGEKLFPSEVIFSLIDGKFFADIL